ncbi:hypothetical protein TIFTF001_028394 [Ficus carica]|uniref:Uncharacterized protein n=1 Tax=Ficus carica TaxID=3494 RepID=A0AA88J150_FICCA|nr:hypothetical protein TIFTF001_028394 [Ficus carica]
MFYYLTGLVHGLNWTGLAAPSTPWLRATVSNLMAICDARRVRKVGRVRVGIRAKVSAFQFHSMPACATVIAHLQVLLANRCLAMDARLWWRTIGEPEILGGSWEDLRTLIIARYGPFPDRDAAMPYQNPEIYNDMNFKRYLSYVADLHAYLNESMGHYCRRLQDAMLPYIPELGSPEMRALQLLRDGLPPEVRTFVQAPMVGMTLENMINDIMEAELIAHMLQVDALVDDYKQEPVNDAGISEPPFHGDPLFLPEDPIPAVPL